MTATDRYVLRWHNELHTRFERHFEDFCEHYAEKCAATYGRYRLERIQQLGDRFTACGEYLQGVARILDTTTSGYSRARAFTCVPGRMGERRTK